MRALAVAARISSLLSALALAEKDLAPSSRRPNVVWLFADDLGFSDLGSYDHPYAVTPNLDRLASEGLSLRNFHVAGATCTPSRTAFMTGRNAALWPNGIADFGLMGTPTIAEQLRDEGGYATAHFGKWHIGPEDHDGAGPAPPGTYGFDNLTLLEERVKDPNGKDASVYEAALDYLERQIVENSSQPFYMSVWGRIPHMKIKAPEGLLRDFKNVTLNPLDFSPHMQQTLDAFERVGENATDMMQRYLTEVYSLDLLIGRVLDLLDDLGVRNDTIIAFSSDQGPDPEHVGYSGVYRGGKHFYYEGGVRVPFIVSWTAEGQIPRGAVNHDSLVSGLDWAPTICSLVGVLCNPALFEGEDLSDILMGQSERSRSNPLFWAGGHERNTRFAMLYNNWKLLTYLGPTEDALYNLEADPEEDLNLWDQNEVVRKVMLASMDEWVATLPIAYCKVKKGCNETLPFDPTLKPVVVGPPSLLSGQRDFICKERTALRLGQFLRIGEGICNADHGFGVGYTGTLSLFNGDLRIWTAKDKSENALVGDFLEMNGNVVLYRSDGDSARESVWTTGCRHGNETVKLGDKLKVYRGGRTTVKLKTVDAERVWVLKNSGKEKYFCSK